MKDRIKQVRLASGLTLTRFAGVLKTSVAAVSRYESGERVPSDAVLKLISKEFSVSFSWLKTGEGPMEDPMPDMALVDKITETYQALPDRLRMLVEALVTMDPEWWLTLDQALDEIERRKKKGAAD